MKAVTIAKIARLVVIIAVGIVIAIPTFAGIESFKFSNGDFVTTDAVYDVDRMTADDLASNIKDNTKGEAGYKINYGTVIGRDVPADEAAVDALASDIKTAAGTSTDFTATLLDKDGKIVKQQMIMWTQGFTQYMTMGLRLGGSMVKMVTPSVSLDSVINGHRVTISNAEVESAGDAYKITIPIPYLVFAAAMADGEHARVGVSIGINYNSFFDATFRLNLPISKFVNNFGGGSEVKLPSYTTNKAEEGSTFTYHSEKAGSPYEGVEVKQEIKIDASGLPGVSDLATSFSEIKIGNFGGEGGGLIVEVNDEGKIQIVSDSDYLVDALKNSREEDGSLKIDIGGEEPVVVEKEQMDSLISMFDELIAQYPDIAGGLGL